MDTNGTVTVNVTYTVESNSTTNPPTLAPQLNNTTVYQTPVQNQLPTEIIIAIAVGAGVFFILVIALLVIIICLRKKRTKSDNVTADSAATSTAYNLLAQREVPEKNEENAAQTKDHSKGNAYEHKEKSDQSKKIPLKPIKTKEKPQKPARHSRTSGSTSSSNGQSLPQDEAKEEEQSDYVNVIRDKKSGAVRPKTHPRSKLTSNSSDPNTPSAGWRDSSGHYEVPKNPVPINEPPAEYLSLLPNDDTYVNADVTTDTTHDLYTYADHQTPSPHLTKRQESQDVYENA
ncbi:uncharacterized protein LOC106167251 [Lingula anatina]|uniref:Uncharacterized protein LOC106167251 n=1 Tax=Lingula anatina TaxID=7574 RepID=A0A1S3ITA4_LINAN|nr:uncharacterized protein LOC106167251 [Lingula anatina]XP_013401433.1 uncharacterized protein LOC106167251 [Lingula anatina]XP_013401434.1 uncharacterized protein LOC106167251 [Lingula anatina]XP_013401435.1 uncharacterized protein LOC106167251 [Lingula anatina]XP_013401436.1 uncharacterized protein LOC106167251 [Lingula anatina]|eukprot:XP_013401432.1 uncharacterized protein LOC106167251 [Lingula anatina]